MHRHRRISRRRSLLEKLEHRSLLAGVFPNDPLFPNQWPLHNTGQTGGTPDADIDAPEAWAVTTGSMTTVIAVLDSGIDYTHPDVYLNMWLNQSEIPAGVAGSLVDVDTDGVITFRDLNAPANAPHVSDVNGNSYIDAGDLLSDSRWENGLDEDGNAKVDDLVGWDFHDNDNDPFADMAVADHGTHISQRLAASGNDGVSMVGVMWQAQLMNVRINLNNGPGNHDVVNCVAGVDYAVAEGASISNNSWLDEPYSQPLYDAIDRARLAGHLFVAAAGNYSQDNDAVPFYPASYDLDNIISVAALDSNDQLSTVSNWGQVSVDLGAPSDTGATSKATPIVTGVAGLLRTVHPDWTYAQIKNQILSTVDPIAALAGKSVTGGRVNAANALGVEQLPTKFYVVDDADRTFEYDENGGAIENHATEGGNASPRGAASTIAGDKVWVVDANRNVYVYNTSGALQGAWTVGGLNASAKLEGITVDGADVWIVDAKSDKVFKFIGAAGALSGTRTASSSFALNKSNGSATDLVTDGASLWVVDNAATDKVFKYTLAGGLLGSWTISNGGGSPTGITLDPANVGDLWIVDNATDRVYEFAGAASRTSGSQAPLASFALAAGNTNPQGIADPPVVAAGDSTESDADQFDLALLLMLEEESVGVKRRIIHELADSNHIVI